MQKNLHDSSGDSVLPELIAWREIGPALGHVLDRVLAAQGDAAEPELVRLQHELTDVLNKSKL